MRRHWLVALILAVPVVALLAAEALQGQIDSSLRDRAHHTFPYPSETDLTRLSARIACARPSQDDEEICRAHTGLEWVIDGAAITAITGLILIAGIAIAGRLARSNRALLVAVFQPGLYVTAVAVAAMVALDAALVCATLYCAESVIFHTESIQIPFFVAMGAIVGIGAMVKALSSAVTRGRTGAAGQAVSRTDAPRLWQAVVEISQKVGAIPPDNLVLGLQPTFYVTETDVATFYGVVTGRTLFCSLPLARILARDEFLSIVGHEMAHFAGGDTAFSGRFYPIYRGTTQSIVSLSAVKQGHMFRSIVLAPAIAVLGYFLESFAAAERALSRERELAADRVGAEVTSAATAASALVKTHAFGPAWRPVQESMHAALQQGKIIENLSVAYVEEVGRLGDAAVLTGLADTHLSHPTDSHPPLGARLASLGRSLADVQEAALTIAPADPAIDLVDHYESRERVIGEILQRYAASHMQVTLPAPNAPASGP